MTRPQLWVWGRQPVLEALRAERARSILIDADPQSSSVLSEIQRAAQRGRVGLRRVSSDEIERLAPGQATQGVVARVEQPPFLTIGELVDRSSESGKTPLLLILDQIQDPRNLGSLLRNADASGAHGVVLTEARSAGITPVVSKASAGALYHMALAPVPNLGRALAELGRRNIWTLALDSSARETIYEKDLTIPLGLVVGAEGQGVRRLTAQKVDMVAAIPMQGRVRSLNVSVAAGVALFEVVRQRRLAQGS